MPRTAPPPGRRMPRFSTKRFEPIASSPFGFEEGDQRDLAEKLGLHLVLEIGEDLAIGTDRDRAGVVGDGDCRARGDSRRR